MFFWSFERKMVFGGMSSCASVRDFCKKDLKNTYTIRNEKLQAFAKNINITQS
jgi:hypothetical protein